MGAPSKRAKRVRSSDEFDIARLEAQLRMPLDGRNTINAWSFAQIYEARQFQQLGQFTLPARMAEQFRTDDALFTAYQNRLAPQSCIPVEIEPAPGARGAAIGCEAEALFGANGVGISAGTLKNIHGCLVDHAVAFANVTATPREDGSRVDFEMHYWPIEYVRWDPTFRIFKARADPTSVQPGDLVEPPGVSYGAISDAWVPIIHGDGRWIIFTDYEVEPFRHATLLPAALVWARHAFAARDWGRGSKAHGSAKVIGELPAGVPLQVDGKISPDATAFIALMRDIASADAPVGIRPAGSKTDFVTNNSNAWQVWAELLQNGEKAAAKIYLGTDGTLGSQGGAPGVDITALFGVAATKVRGDLECISRGIDSGLIVPWTAVNFGDSKLAPKRKYIVPNDDAEAVTTDYATRNAAFTTALSVLRTAGVSVTPEYIAKLAEDYRVRVPILVSSAPAAQPVTPPATSST